MLGCLARFLQFVPVFNHQFPFKEKHSAIYYNTIAPISTLNNLKTNCSFNSSSMLKIIEWKKNNFSINGSNSKYQKILQKSIDRKKLTAWIAHRTIIHHHFFSLSSNQHLSSNYFHHLYLTLDYLLDHTTYLNWNVIVTYKFQLSR